MDDIKKIIIKGRLENISRILAVQSSGAHIHQVINMKHVADGLIDHIDDNPDIAAEVTARLEKQLVDYFKKKYGWR